MCISDMRGRWLHLFSSPSYNDNSMGRQKRATTPRSAKPFKKSKNQPKLPLRTPRPRSTLPYRWAVNAKESRLLALPAELGEQIWTYAFGCRTIHARVKIADAHKRVRRISFVPCQEQFLDDEVYELSLPGRLVTTGRRWAAATAQARRNGTFIGSHRDCLSEDHKYHPIIPLVCKQIHHEAVQIAWKTSTFAFDSGPAFQRFLMSPVARLELVHQLSVHHISTRWKDDDWIRILNTSPRRSEFPSLQGLNYVDLVRGPHRAGIDLDVMKDSNHLFALAASVVRRFRLFPLLNNLTTVFVHCDSACRLTLAERVTLAERIQSLLLNKSVR